MKRGTAARRSSTEVHSHLTIAVEGYEASVSARVNHYAYEPRYAFRPLDDQPVHEFSSRLVVAGTIVSEGKSATNCCLVTLYGDPSPAFDLDARLEDIAELDDHGSPRYRQYRGKEVPVYRPPKGLGVLGKVKGQPEWQTSLFVKPVLVDRWLTLLCSSRDLFMSLHECKTGRTRWVRGIELGTVNPEEE
ncbi:hypothetical protein [Altererythrobacter sp. Z27]|uniref:hypothetical protein n=1 Tax=Altererythrobacter sp. Z27 TaxID=3461147 RepID=UPI0040444B38